MNDYKKKCAVRLKTAREEQGLTMDDVVAKTGGVIKRSRLSNYENGWRTPGAWELVQLERALDRPAAYLMGLTDMQTMLATNQEESLLLNWRKLPENRRMSYYREIELDARKFADAPNKAQRPKK